MTEYVTRAGMRVAASLADLIETQAMDGLHLDTDAFWTGTAAIMAELTPENRALLASRDALQKQIDDWYDAHPATACTAREYRSFLENIGYLTPEPAPFTIGTENVDDELARRAGPQLVVPVRNPRYALNAANARWGSLYDSLYGTDVIPRSGSEKSGYDPERGTKVIAMAKAFLDEILPLADGKHAGVSLYRVVDAGLVPALKDPASFVGYRGETDAPRALLFAHHGNHIEIAIDRTHPIGKSDKAGVSDIILEAALSTIVDLEDSIAAVDAEDKTDAYANWLGLMRGDLSAEFEKNGRRVTRRLTADRAYMRPDLTSYMLKGRSLLLVRNVGHLMTTPALLLPDGSEAFEGILDAVMTSLIAMHDLLRTGDHVNSATGSVYIVKPKMHGSAECAFTDRLFTAVEHLLGLAANTLKVGVMDEERRTSVNLRACIKAVRNRIVFINTGFLDRTGDEIHTAMRAGPVVRKAEMKSSAWIAAYEARNVAAGLGCGFAGKAQIGKGMWAAPDRMADMLKEKIAHVESGATTAWVPSPTAAVLHAIHYHRVDIAMRQREIGARDAPKLDDLLTVPLAPEPNWSAREITNEVASNAQGILGYVVRWIDQGVGCSKVPDVNNIGLMEDRATLRISSQHIANWLAHGICSKEQVEEALRRMAARVDAQNAGDPAYRPMAPACDGLAFQAARALIFEGITQPNGYTEPLLHAYRTRAKNSFRLTAQSP